MSEQPTLRGMSIAIFECAELASAGLAGRLSSFEAEVHVVSTFRQLLQLTLQKRIDIAFIGFGAGEENLKAGMEEVGIPYILCGSSALTAIPGSDLKTIVRIGSSLRHRIASHSVL